MNEKYMSLALKEAEKAFAKDEVPVGAIIVCNDKVIAKAHNLKESKNSTLAHAEIIAINKATKKKKNWRLNDCIMYVTLEPCPMCASAIQQSRIKKVYYGTKNSDMSNHLLFTLICEKSGINSPVSYEGEILEKNCKDILQNFFQQQRCRTKLRNKKF